MERPEFISDKRSEKENVNFNSTSNIKLEKKEMIRLTSNCKVQSQCLQLILP